MSITEKNQKKLERFANIVDNGSVGISVELDKLDDKIDVTKDELSLKIDEVKSIAETTQKMEGRAGHTPTEDELVSLITPLIPAPIPGKDAVIGDTLVEEIATLVQMDIEVPVVEKVIERIETIHEQPIVTNEIKEVALPITPEEVRDRLEILKDDERLDGKAIKGFERVVHQEVLDRAVSILDSRTSFLINKVSNLSDKVNNAPTGGTPGGSNTQVQFNDGGAFGGDAGFTYNKATDYAWLHAGLEVGAGSNPAIYGGRVYATSNGISMETNDTNTNGRIIFGNVSGTEFARFRGDGNFGIGVNDPQEPLHVVGNYRLSKSGTPTKFLLFKTTGTGVDITSNGGTDGFFINYDNNENVTIGSGFGLAGKVYISPNSTGNVGVGYAYGSTLPTKLSVAGASSHGTTVDVLTLTNPASVIGGSSASITTGSRINFNVGGNPIDGVLTGAYIEGLFSDRSTFDGPDGGFQFKTWFHNAGVYTTPLSVNIHGIGTYGSEWGESFTSSFPNSSTGFDSVGGVTLNHGLNPLTFTSGLGMFGIGSFFMPDGNSGGTYYSFTDNVYQMGIGMSQDDGAIHFFVSPFPGTFIDPILAPYFTYAGIDAMQIQANGNVSVVGNITAASITGAYAGDGSALTNIQLGNTVGNGTAYGVLALDSSGSAPLADSNFIYDGSTVIIGSSFKVTGNTGFFGTTPINQQVDGAGLTNNIASGGTTNTLTNWTNLTTYSTDAAAIRNAIYQLGRKLKIVDDALRAYGLLS